MAQESLRHVVAIERYGRRLDSGEAAEGRKEVDCANDGLIVDTPRGNAAGLSYNQRLPDAALVEAPLAPAESSGASRRLEAFLVITGPRGRTVVSDKDD